MNVLELEKCGKLDFGHKTLVIFVYLLNQFCFNILISIFFVKLACSGFLCDQKRCIPADWQCDGHVDCLDQTDESKCDSCSKGSIYCGDRRCMSQKHVCDGVQDCPWGQDERNCSNFHFFFLFVYSLNISFSFFF